MKSLLYHPQQDPFEWVTHRPLVRKKTIMVWQCLLMAAPMELGCHKHWCEILVEQELLELQFERDGKESKKCELLRQWKWSKSMILDGNLMLV